MQRTVYPYDVFFRSYPRNGYAGLNYGSTDGLTVQSTTNAVLGLIEKAGKEADDNRTDKQKERLNVMGEPDPNGSPSVSYHETAVRNKAQISAMAMTAQEPYTAISEILSKGNKFFVSNWVSVAPVATKEFKEYQNSILEEIAKGTYNDVPIEAQEKIKEGIKQDKKTLHKWYEKPEPYLAFAVVSGLFFATYIAKRLK